MGDGTLGATDDGIIRTDPSTGKSIQLRSAARRLRYQAIRYLPEIDRVLAKTQSRDFRTPDDRYWLIDPATGKSSRIKTHDVAACC